MQHFKSSNKRAENPLFQYLKQVIKYQHKIFCLYLIHEITRKMLTYHTIWCPEIRMNSRYTCWVHNSKNTYIHCVVQFIKFKIHSSRHVFHCKRKINIYTHHKVIFQHQAPVSGFMIAIFYILVLRENKNT